MIFITERDLRQKYKQEPFEQYHVSQNIRLTPGAKQFLLDKRIKIINSGKTNVNNNSNLKFNKHKSMNESLKKDKEQKKNIKNDLKIIDAAFLQQAATIWPIDGQLANKIMELEYYLKSFDNEEIINSFKPIMCKYLNENRIDYPQGECFPLTSEIILSDKGLKVSSLNLLRNSLNKFYFEFEESFTISQKKFIGCLINHISELIHLTIGGSECLRKNMDSSTATDL